jgi:hypothetical protein
MPTTSRQAHGLGFRIGVERGTVDDDDRRLLLCNGTQGHLVGTSEEGSLGDTGAQRSQGKHKTNYCEYKSHDYSYRVALHHNRGSGTLRQ